MLYRNTFIHYQRRYPHGGSSEPNAAFPVKIGHEIDNRSGLMYKFHISRPAYFYLVSGSATES